ncbi:P-loop containing nucleoside triphosphate hydrolase protein [Panaeolus papilionaceus]|nr:P-loop containing nucleoside triphosphate hydrolase protein [Panaeolus papilionaceus]
MSVHSASGLTRRRLSSKCDLWVQDRCRYPQSKSLKPTCGRTYSSNTDIFSNSGAAEFIAAAKTFASIPKSTGLPEVCLIYLVAGRANAGKSSLFNAVIGRNALLGTSAKAGHTKSLNFYRIGAEPGKLLLVDAPGYGARGRPEWGDLFDQYISKREQLKRIYILFNAKHGLNDFDRQMLAHLSGSLLTDRGTQPFTLQAVITKVDLVPSSQLQTTLKTIREDIWKSAPLCLSPLITSSAMSPPFGIEAVRKNIKEACSL